jgi:signal transduction histidine kinase
MARVLVVDDRTANRELLVTMLRHGGHETVEAAGGSEALRAVRAEVPDLVITDIVMPGMDGYELVRQLRAEPGIEQPRVVFCTATYLADQAQELAAACGIHHVIEKPVDPVTFLDTVRQALGSAYDGAPVSDDESFDQVHLRLVNQKLLEKVMELEAANLERRRLLAGLVRAQEDERSRIASDIHDDSIQIMAAVALRLEMMGEDLTDPEQHEALADLAARVGKAVSRLRRLIFDLSPRSLESGGLAGAIEAYLGEIAAETGFRWRVEGDRRDDLSDEVEVILYRIAQEAIRNAQKHAQAGLIAITLGQTEGGTSLRVADDGVGFDPGEALRHLPGHLGLASIRERATMAGGHFTLQSAPGAGCVLEVWIPDSLAGQ